MFVLFRIKYDNNSMIIINRIIQFHNYAGFVIIIYFMFLFDMRFTF